MLLILTAFLLYMLFHPAQAFLGAKNGLLLWFYTILPTLLPYIIISNILIYTGKIEVLMRPLTPFFHRVFRVGPYGGYAVLAGCLCGYPMGAKTVADLYMQKQISNKEACYLLGFVNNPSPAFLISYVIEGNLQGNHLILLIVFYSAMFLTMLFLQKTLFRNSLNASAAFSAIKKETPRQLSIGELLDVSILNSFETIVKLGGYIILCSILIGALGQLPQHLQGLKLVIAPLIEVSTGIQLLASSLTSQKLCTICLLCSCSLGGGCILLQTYSVISKSKLPLRYYLSGKLIQTAITAGILLFFC